MSMEVRLKAEKRDEKGKGAARKLRARGRVPAVLYGRDDEAMHLSVEAHEAEQLFQSITVENTIVGLEIRGERGPVQTLIREIQVHPFKPLLFHLDFYRIRAGEMLEVEIPLHLSGTPEGVRTSGGILQQTIHEVLVRCLPTEIPESIEVDVSELEIGGAVHVSDLRLAEGVEILLEPDQTICSVVAPRVEVEAVEEEVEEEEREPEAEEGPEGEAED